MPIPMAVTRVNQRVLNPLMLRLTGHASIVDLEHVGRRTGRVHHSPLMAFHHGDVVTIALTYGPDVQWLKNIRAAGTCRIRLGRQILTLGPPRPLGAAQGLARMPQPHRTLLRWPVRCEDFVELSVLAARPVAR